MSAPIARRDLIALGGNFTIDTFDSHALPRWATTDSNRYQHDPLMALHGKMVDVEVVAGYADILLTPQGSNRLDQVRLRVGMFMDDTSRNRGRVAQFIAPMDREAGDALAIDHWSHRAPSHEVHRPGVACLTRRDLSDFGLDQDAGLFVAVQQRDDRALKHYRAMGADPLRPTPEGDCAARLATSQGSFTFTQTSELVNARHLRSGETGAFQLARNDQPGSIVSLVDLGLDCSIQGHDGKTVLDHFRNHQSRAQVEQAVAVRQQEQMETRTAKVPASIKFPDLNDDRVLDQAMATRQQQTARRGMRL
jgi:hypothetical protein